MSIPYGASREPPVSYMEEIRQADLAANGQYTYQVMPDQTEAEFGEDSGV